MNTHESLENFLDKRKKAEDKATIESLPLFQHAKKVEKKTQLAEQMEITQNAKNKDILNTNPPKMQDKKTPDEDDNKDPGDKYWTTQEDWRKSSKNKK